jgi:hypothetical protein
MTFLSSKNDGNIKSEETCHLERSLHPELDPNPDWSVRGADRDASKNVTDRQHWLWGGGGVFP